MIEGSPDDGNFLVRVRAQVMTRDDNTGGWVPLGGGGLSNVSVRKRIVTEEENRPEYVICGKRISDQTIILSCSIRRDFQYNIVMPTFHHWKTGDKKYGLTFQTAADGRAFDKGVRSAIEDLLEEDDDHNNRRPGARGKVFVAVELPPPGLSSESANGNNRSGSSGIMGGGDSHSLNSSPYSHHLSQRLRPSRTVPGGVDAPRSTLVSSISAGPGDIRRVQQQEDAWSREQQQLYSKDPDSEKIELSSLGGGYPYVQFARDNRGSSRPEHEYSYPSMDPLKLADLAPSAKKAAPEPPLLLPSKVKSPDKESSRRQSSSPIQLRCRHCLEDYTEAENRPGSCPYGYDRTLKCINRASCLCFAESVFYHCISDEEGHYGHTCSCDTSDDHCRGRWTGLALLSIIIPCLWCYQPLRACHRCGVGCGYCGGVHEP